MAGMKTKSFIACSLALLFAGFATAQEIPQYKWQVRQDRLTDRNWTIKRAETVILSPSYMDADGPIALTNVYEVMLRWQPYNDTNVWHYATNGIVVDAGAGEVQCRWLPGFATAEDEIYTYEIALKSAAGQNLRAGGLITMLGSLSDAPVTNLPATLLTFDWSLYDHINIASSPFADASDLLYLSNRLDGHDTAISNVTALVGNGVAGVTSTLNAHIGEQIIRDSGQDQQISLALDSATMGGDTTGKSSNTTVIATRGRLFPAAEDTPADKEAIVWDAASGRYIHGSVDLSGINASISTLTSNAVTKSYVDFEVSTVRGLVDGNDHVHQLTETFNGVDWLEIASGVWQHSSGWMAYNAQVIGGDLRLQPDVGYMVMSATGHVSKISISPSNNIWLAQFGTNAAPSTWYGYDAIRGNIPATNMFGVRLYNGGGSIATVSQIDLYSWQFPERVGFTRDFAGLHLLVDTPSGATAREAANVQYVRTLAATGDISGTPATGYSVDKIKGGAINATARANGYGPIWYSSVSEHRYVDLATQFELDAAVSPLCTIASYNALQSRVAAAEAGAIAISGDVTGSHLQTTTVTRIQGKAIAAPTSAGTTPVYNGSGIVWQSVISSNLVYAAGTNDIGSVPEQSAAFYRAMYGTNTIMVMVLDQQIKGWFGPDGLTIPQGTINLMQSNLTANVRMYDGTAGSPALSFLSDPSTGWSRPAADTWRFISAGNVVADIGVDGITMRPGKTITGLTGYVTGTPWTVAGYIGAPAATSAAQAVVGAYTGSIASAVQPTDPTYTQTVFKAANAIQTNQTLYSMIHTGRAVVSDNTLPAVDSWIDFISYADEGKSGIRFSSSSLSSNSVKMYAYGSDGPSVDSGVAFGAGDNTFALINPIFGFMGKASHTSVALFDEASGNPFMPDGVVKSSGSNLLWVAGGVTNRIMLGAYP